MNELEKEVEEKIQHLLKKVIFDRLDLANDLIHYKGIVKELKLTKSQQEAKASQHKKTGRKFGYTPQDNKLSKETFISTAGVFLLGSAIKTPPEELAKLSDSLYKSYSDLFDAECDRRMLAEQKKRREEERGDLSEKSAFEKFSYALKNFFINLKEWWVAADKRIEKGKSGILDNVFDMTLKKVTEERAAIKIQSLARRVAAKKQVRQLREDQAATKVQSLVRGMFGRKEADKKREDKAATKIQSLVRGVLGRNKAEELKKEKKKKLVVDRVGNTFFAPKPDGSRPVIISPSVAKEAKSVAKKIRRPKKTRTPPRPPGPPPEKKPSSHER
ncbi:MAG: hypothetical protein RLN62_01645 [Rickettsiales bacterium]